MIRLCYAVISGVLSQFADEIKLLGNFVKESSLALR